MRLWRIEITYHRPPRPLAPREALVKGEAATLGLYVCTGCGWAFRYLGDGIWRGAYWPKCFDDERTYDSRDEWSGHPNNRTTDDLAEAYADCFGRLSFREPILQRRWDAP